MANIISISYFDGGELNIPNTGNMLASSTSVLNELISKYEIEYLTKALGYSFFKLFYADNYPAPATQRFQALLTGNNTLGTAEWTDKQGNVHQWTGLNTAGKSPIAAYIYYWYQKNNHTQTTSQGETKNKTENSVNVTPAWKLMKAWNEMQLTTIKMQLFLKNAAENGVLIYPEFKWRNAEDFGVMW